MILQILILILRNGIDKKYFVILPIRESGETNIGINIPKNNCGYQVYESQYTLDNGYSFTNIQVCGMKDKDLEKKINESLNSCFYILSDTCSEKVKQIPESY